MYGTSVSESLREVNSFLGADGASLVLVSADPKTARIELALDLSGVACAECIVAPDVLAGIVHDSLERHLRQECELVLDDPRASSRTT